MATQAPIDLKFDAPACATHMTELRLSAEAAERLATLSKALGHPVRVQIVEMLGRYEGEVCVCEVERHFDLTQPTISHHLRVLREAGIIDGEQRGLCLLPCQTGRARPAARVVGKIEVGILAQAWVGMLFFCSPYRSLSI